MTCQILYKEISKDIIFMEMKALTPSDMVEQWIVSEKAIPQNSPHVYTAYMKDKSTAWNCAKGLRHPLPKNFDWKDAGVDVQGNEDIQELAKQIFSWKAFS